MPIAVLVLAFGMIQQDWYTFEPEGKNFRVELPSKPGSTSSRTVGNAAVRAKLVTAQLRTSEATYSIQVTESPAKINPGTLDDGIRRFGASRQGELGALTTITVDGHPGREFEMTERADEGPKRSKMRWVASENALFILTVTAKPGGKNGADADRFLKSLEIGVARSGDLARVEADEPVDGKTTAKEGATDEDKSKEATRPAVRKPTTLTKVTTIRVPKGAKAYPAEDLVDLPRSYVEKERDGFRDLGPDGSVLVGVRVSYIERFGGPKVRSVQPIYRSGKNLYQGRIYGEAIGPFATFVASPGYAVGGFVTHTGLTLDGFGIVFMKVDGDHLDPEDTYNSPWIGDKKGGGPGSVTTTGGLVVGLQGRADKEAKALGLTMLK